jgi:LuxR family maltose regulon positive regulatory protein
MQNPDLLIRTKIRPPFTRTELVSRPSLEQQIGAGLHLPLTLITAPAGFGKTTLVAACVSQSSLPVAWLSLDQNDNQTWLFLTYLLAALQGVDDSIGSEAAQLLAGSQQAPSETILTSLINDLDIVHTDMVLVLDDYQFINNQAVHEAVAFLLEYCPKTLHLVIATRSDPALPLARLRARGQMVELRASDLRFTEAEAAQFLNGIMGLHLDAEPVSLLEERTEGWIAGLQMAALSMHNRDDKQSFVEGFSGTNRYILDYLLEEVLANQTAEIQRFLLSTSILERFSAPLCDALAEIHHQKGESGGLSQSSSLDSQSILEFLERASLFLIPLDEERHWYRYHHLFADLLRARLDQTLPSQDIAALHKRAAQWYEDNKLTYAAIYHASLISDNEWVERLIEQNYMKIANQGEYSYSRLWTGRLSKELIYNRPQLCVYEAWSRAWFGQLEDADQLLDRAEKQFQAEPSTPDTQALLGYLIYIRSRVIAMRGDIPQAIALGLRARETVIASKLSLQLGISITLGYEYFLTGDFARASDFLNETIQSGMAVGAVNTTIAAYCVLSRLSLIQGRLNCSYELLQKADAWIRNVGGQHLGVKGIIAAGLADLLYERNDLESALAQIQKGLELMPLWGKADDFILAYATLARIHLAQGHKEDAEGALEKAGQIIQTRGVFPEARLTVENTWARLWLAEGKSHKAERMAETPGNHPGPGIDDGFGREQSFMIQARVFIAQNKYPQAVQLLSRLEEAAESGGRLGRLIEILLLKALALHKLGESTLAWDLLAKSLTLAEPEGYVRIFIDEGLSVRQLLIEWLAQASASPLQNYANRLLSEMEPESQPGLNPPGKVPSVNVLAEPLSPRELEVLRLIALGKNNQEIADTFVVARGTIKAQAASIYRKLDVSNRTEAVARARQLGILH